MVGYDCCLMAMTEPLFLSDSYATAFEAKVLSVRPGAPPAAGPGLVLDRTLFYYTSGGQPCDKGKIRKKVNGAEESNGLGAVVKEVKKADGEVVHYLEAPVDGALQPPLSFAPGDLVQGEIDWPRRHRLMRMHTAGLVLSALFFKKGVMITGNQLDVEQSRFDFSMEEFDRALIDSVISEANLLGAQSHAIHISSLPREEALKLPGMVKLAGALPPSLTTLRIVEIEGIDTQADGGTHVRNTQEVGTIELVRVENKGAKNRRIYFTLKP